jgi:Flp pilus assembly protein TadB
MAQTRKKRRTKHRGNAAGTIETRGRTGRPPSPEERKKQDRTKRAQARLAKPPSWSGATKKAGLAAGVMLIFLLVTTRKILPAIVFAVLAMALYVPSGYYLDAYMYRRRMRKEAGPK